MGAEVLAVNRTPPLSVCVTHRGVVADALPCLARPSWSSARIGKNARKRAWQHEEWVVHLRAERLPRNPNDLLEVVDLVALALGQPLDIVSPSDAIGNADIFIAALRTLAQPYPVVRAGVVSPRARKWSSCRSSLTPSARSLPICVKEVAVVDTSGALCQPRHESVRGLDVETSIVYLHRLA